MTDSDENPKQKTKEPPLGKSSSTKSWEQVGALMNVTSFGNMHYLGGDSGEASYEEAEEPEEKSILENMMKIAAVAMTKKIEASPTVPGHGTKPLVPPTGLSGAATAATAWGVTN